MPQAKILFILKKRQDYTVQHHSHVGLSTGLYNSATFMHDMLMEYGFKSDIIVVNDNNDIDREVTKFRPTHVIIEALWVTPTKFNVLQRLHPNVKWIIRLHSEIPFIANEGIAMDWIGEYSVYENVIVAANSDRALDDVRFYIKEKNGWDRKKVEEKVIYLPNYYPQQYTHKHFNKDKDYIDVCCFGAVRPLKNHLNQAIASIRFADKIRKKLRFNINVGRVEGKGEPVLNNLKGFFQQLEDSGHELVMHSWRHREEFLELCHSMDMGLQVSFSETFNIVGADLISQGVPLVASNEIPWANPLFCADPEDSEQIAEKMLRTYRFPQFNVITNRYLLNDNTTAARKAWVKYFKKYNSK